MKAMMVGLFAVLGAFSVCSEAFAQSSIVISQLQTGDAQSGNNEAAEIYNNTNQDHEITNWCVRYSAYSSINLASNPKYCFLPVDEMTKIYLKARNYATIVTTTYPLPAQAVADGIFSGNGMGASGGHLSLIDAAGVPADKVGWGTARYSEGYIFESNPAPLAPSSGESLYRKLLSSSELQDTDNNRNDFELKTPGWRLGGIYEIKSVIDICANLADIQESLPSGYGYDDSGNCELLASDLCSNIDAIQISFPEGMIGEAGGCYHDVCANISELQQEVPTGYIKNEGECHPLEARPIWLSELLPNVAGSDTGKEYIELYNPHDELINLAGYVLQVGKSYEKYIPLTTGTIAAHSFALYRDDELGFTLLNTTSNVRLVSPAGNIVSETTYSEPKDDQSWSFFDDGWFYTNVVTPLDANSPMTVLGQQSADDGPISLLATCTAGKYRHPLTNRCRNIEEDASTLTDCGNDEYRNPTTNRCRKLAAVTTTLTSCQPGYERNIATNRCRKLVAAGTGALAPCKTGYERNPATNRCRKSATLGAMAAGTIAERRKTENPATQQTLLQNALIVTVGVGAVGYGLYEWRSEFMRALRRLYQAATGN